MKIIFTLQEALEIIRDSNVTFEEAELVIEGFDSVEDEPETKEEKVVRKRHRRTKAEIEAEKAQLEIPGTEDCKALESVDAPVEVKVPVEAEPEAEPEIILPANTDMPVEPIVEDKPLFGSEAIPDEVATTPDDAVIDLTQPLFG
ncbi:MAG: hypothetical protein ACRCR2_02330 [Fusobacteriaceae bacterium]